VDAKIIPIKPQASFRVLRDDLKQVVFGDVQNFGQRPSDDQANLNSKFRFFALKQINTNGRHAVSFDECT